MRGEIRFVISNFYQNFICNCGLLDWKYTGSKVVVYWKYTRSIPGVDWEQVWSRHGVTTVRIPYSSPAVPL